MNREDRRRARQVLESSRVEWQRDFDAVVIGFVLGVLVTLVLGFGVRLMIDEDYRPMPVEAR